MNRFIFSFVISFIFLEAKSEPGRRLGKLENQTWTEHLSLARNQFNYSSSDQIPDFSSVGALVSNNGVVGTATLIAPNLVVSAAHVVKNSLNDPSPDPEDWSFVLSDNFETALISQTYSISRIIIHPGWIARQTPSNKIGDGDKIGVDLCLAFLDGNVHEVYPMAFPFGANEAIGQRVFIAGFGNQVDGGNGIFNSSNSNRFAGENILDRVVETIEIASLNSGYWGGLLAVDFDSPQKNANFLGNAYSNVDYLGSGDSDPAPLPLEVSTAVGDSGGPIIIRHDDEWKIHGVVSYGTNESFYGDITVFTRLASHQDWIRSYLPSWSEAKVLEDGQWRQSKWLGIFHPLEKGWNFHSQYGWFFCLDQKGSSMWAWHSVLGWLWTNASVFPFFYSDDRENWIYLETESSSKNDWLVYCYGKDSWEQILQIF